MPFFAPLELAEVDAASPAVLLAVVELIFDEEVAETAIVDPVAEAAVVVEAAAIETPPEEEEESSAVVDPEDDAVSVVTIGVKLMMSIPRAGKGETY